MDVMNDLYKGQCLVLPNEYVFLTGELRATNHTRCVLHGKDCSHALPYSHCMLSAAGRLCQSLHTLRDWKQC